MSVPDPPIYAVLTGDIVGSGRLAPPQRHRLLTALRGGASKLKEHFGDALIGGVDLFRGDSWQCVLSDPGASLRVALFYRALLRAEMNLKALDTRIAIGVGEVAFLPEGTASTGDGQAFHRSGEALDTMSRGTQMRFCGPEAIGSLSSTAVDVSVQLIDVLARGWTGRQAMAVSGALLGWTQDRIARDWFDEPITQQAIAQHLDRAGWSAIQAALDHFEAGLGGRRADSVPAPQGPRPVSGVDKASRL